MLKSYTPSQWTEKTEYQLVFDDGRGNGMAFDCDADGNVFPWADDAVEEVRRRNIADCMAHPEKYVRYNKVVAHTKNCKEPPVGLCECGEEFPMYNEYMGACECPGCGKWYNLFGQELLPPENWEEDY